MIVDANTFVDILLYFIVRIFSKTNPPTSIFFSSKYAILFHKKEVIS